MRLRRTPPSAIAVAAALAVTGCVDAGRPTVGIRPISADVVFGLVPATKPAPLPGVAPVLAPDTVSPRDPEDDAFVLDEPAQPADVGAVRPKPGVKPIPAAPACRKATVNDFAPEASPANVAQPPTPGIYRWKFEFTFPFTNPVTKQVEPGRRSGFFERKVIDVRTLPAGGHEYTVLSPELNGLTSRTRYRVRPNGVSRTTSLNTGVSSDPAQLVTDIVGVNPRDELPPEATGTVDGANNTLTGTTLNTGEPDRGLAVLSVDQLDGSGNAVDSTSYATPLLLLPLPVTVGSSFQSVAVDTKTLSNQSVQGTTSRQDEVDACGSPVRGWIVESTDSITTAEGVQQVTARRHVATQYGGLIIGERFEAATTPPTVYTATLASPQPRPLDG